MGAAALAAAAVILAVAVIATRECDAVESFAGSMHNLGISYDYDPSPSPEALAEESAALVQGRLISLRQEAAEGDLVGPFLVFTIRVENVLRQTGGPAIGDEIDMSVLFNPAGRDFAGLDESFVAGVPVVAFLDAGPWPGGWAPFLEGFWIACDRDHPALSVLVDPSRWTSTGTLADLTDAATVSEPTTIPSTTEAANPSRPEIPAQSPWIRYGPPDDPDPPSTAGFEYVPPESSELAEDDPFRSAAEELGRAQGWTFVSAVRVDGEVNEGRSVSFLTPDGRPLSLGETQLGQPYYVGAISEEAFNGAYAIDPDGIETFLIQLRPDGTTGRVDIVTPDGRMITASLALPQLPSGGTDYEAAKTVSGPPFITDLAELARSTFIDID